MAETVGLRRERSNKRLEQTGGQPPYFMRALVAAGRSTAVRWAAP